jgi:hypothetical protein
MGAGQLRALIRIDFVRAQGVASNKPEHTMGTGGGGGDLCMWLQLTWLQFAVVRGPVGVIGGRFGTGLGPNGPQPSSKSTPSDPDRTSDNLQLQPHDLAVLNLARARSLSFYCFLFFGLFSMVWGFVSYLPGPISLTKLCLEGFVVSVLKNRVMDPKISGSPRRLP